MGMMLPTPSSRMSRSRIMRRSSSITTSTGTSTKGATSASIEWGVIVLLLQIHGVLRERVGGCDDLSGGFVSALIYDQTRKFMRDIHRRRFERSRQHVPASAG